MTFIDVGPINNKETNWAYTIEPYRLEFTYFQLLGFEGVIQIGCGSRGLWVEGIWGSRVVGRGGHEGNPKYYTTSAKAYATL